MNLFSPHPADNLLPYDGIVNDYGIIFAPQQADDYLDYLQQHIAWRHDEAVIYGKHITTARQVAWYGAQNFAYTYSGTTRTALPWDGVLADIKQLVEQHIAAVSPTRFNSRLLNHYADGSQGMAQRRRSLLGQKHRYRLRQLRSHPKICLQTQTNAGKTRTHAATRAAHRHARQHPNPLAARHYEKQQNPHPAHQPDLPHHAAAGVGQPENGVVGRALMPDKHRKIENVGH